MESSNTFTPMHDHYISCMMAASRYYFGGVPTAEDHREWWIEEMFEYCGVDMDNNKRLLWRFSLN